MNQPIRRVATLVTIMFFALLCAVTVVQFVKAPEFRNDARNARTIYQEYGSHRGPIIVDGTPIVTSEPVDDNYKYLRTYAQADMYSHLTGYFSVAFNSATGLERTENDVLGGTSDSLAFERIKNLFKGNEDQGGGVELTIDPVLQQRARELLGDQRGAIVAIEPESGRILAMVSTPSFDPNAIASHDTQAARDAYSALSDDENKPLINRAIGGDLYAPGSVFKLVTASAMLEDGLNPDDLIEAPTEYSPPGTSHIIRNPGQVACGDGSGEVTLTVAIAQSCNTPFAIAAGDLGADALREQAEKFGFGQPLNIPLPVTQSVFPEPDSQSSLALTGFGQWDVRVTPLEMAMVTSAIANDGSLMTPYLVERELSPDLSVVNTTSPSEFSEPISSETAAELTEMMVEVVNSGTGRAAALPGVQVAGKTGTAEVSADVAQHAWFVGFAPADNPDVAIAVILENGGDLGFDAYGSVNAAPIAQQLFEVALR